MWYSFFDGVLLTVWGTKWYVYFLFNWLQLKILPSPRQCLHCWVPCRTGIIFDIFSPKRTFDRDLITKIQQEVDLRPVRIKSWFKKKERALLVEDRSHGCVQQSVQLKNTSACVLRLVWVEGAPLNKKVFLWSVGIYLAIRIRWLDEWNDARITGSSGVSRIDHAQHSMWISVFPCAQVYTGKQLSFLSLLGKRKQRCYSALPYVNGWDGKRMQKHLIWTILCTFRLNPTVLIVYQW